MALRIRRVIALLVTSTLMVMFIVGSDLAARYWLAVNTPPTFGQYRLSHPPAYADSPYYSAEFVQEMAAFIGRDGDFRGRWINRTGIERRTVGQPANALYNIYLFGSSTTMNPEVPDEYTIASFLQHLMPQHRVVNLGAVGQWSKLQYLLLKTLQLRRGDIVIFYDGLADASIGFRGDDARRDATLPGKVCNWLFGGLSNLGLVQLYCEIADRGTPLLDQHPPVSLAADFEQSQIAAWLYCQQRGVAFYHFLQPLVWSKEMSPYEEWLAGNYRMLPRGEGAYITEAWPALESITRRLPGGSLYHAVDELRTPETVIYLDYDHMTERGNEAVARAIYNYLTIY